jgi:Toxin co-regulated pilus biosynthesis protein Q
MKKYTNLSTSLLLILMLTCVGILSASRVSAQGLGIQPLTAERQKEISDKEQLTLNIKKIDGVKQWEVRADDQRLSRSFERWAKQAGAVIKWDAPHHVLIGASTVYSGTLEEALFEALASPGIFQGEERLEACIYPNNPRLIRVTRYGAQVRECPFKE